MTPVSLAAQAVVSGALAFLAQQLLTRELLVSFGENILYTSLFLGTWLAFAGLGSVVALGTGPTALSVPWLITGQVLALPACLIVARFFVPFSLPHPSLALVALAAILVMGLPAFVAGRVYQALSRDCDTGGSGILLAAESLGAAAGLALHGLGRTRSAAPFEVCGVIFLTIGIWALIHVIRPSSTFPARAWRSPALALVLTGVLLAARGPALERRTLQWVWFPLDVTLSLDTPFGRLTVLDWFRGDRILMVNRFPMHSLRDDAAHNEGLAHLPLFLHPDPRRVLLIGGGVGGCAREVLRHPVEEVILCELDPAILTLAGAFFHDSTGSAFHDRRLVALGQDGARFLEDQPIEYDAIILDLPNPYDLQLVRFYTREFFERARSRLKPGGMMVIQLPTVLASPGATRTNRLLGLTMRAVFPERLVLCGRLDYVVGFKGQAPPLERLAEGWLDRPMALKFLDQKWLRRNLDEKHRRWRLAHLLDPDPEAPISTLDSPAALAMDLHFWASLGHRGTGLLPASLADLGKLWVFLGLLLVFWIVPIATSRCLGGGGVRKGTWAGLASMSLTVLAAYLVPMRTGSLIFVLPLLSAAFIAGHGLGALAGASRFRPAPALSMGVLGLTGLVLPWILESVPAEAAIAAGTALLVIGGASTGSLLPALAAQEKRPRLAALLYGADLVGAAIAIFVVAPVALPLVGARATGALILMSLAPVGLGRERIRLTPDGRGVAVDVG